MPEHIAWIKPYGTLYNSRLEPGYLESTLTGTFLQCLAHSHDLSIKYDADIQIVCDEELLPLGRLKTMCPVKLLDTVRLSQNIKSGHLFEFLSVNTGAKIKLPFERLGMVGVLVRGGIVLTQPNKLRIERLEHTLTNMGLEPTS